MLLERPADIVTQIKIHSMTKKERYISMHAFKNYFRRKTGSSFEFLE